jgi:3-carboxy-cis,cis-muconate cycloisomerase
VTGSLLEPGSHRAAALADDRALIAAMLRVEVAWVRALALAGAVSSDVVGQVERAVATLDVNLPPAEVEAAGNPVLPLVEALRAALGTCSASGVVHRGLTSQDVLDTALMLLAADCLDSVTVSMQRTGDALAALAASQAAAPAAGRTLTQHAVPVTIGLRAAQWLMSVADARATVLTARAHLPVQCGGAAGTLALAGQLVPDPLATAGTFADLLALTMPPLPWHTRRTPVLRLASALAEVCAALGVIAGNVLLLGRPEFGELSEGTLLGRGSSSTMPGKVNPVLSVLVRSAALQAPQLLAQLHLSAGQVVDERPPGEWHAEWPALRRLLVLTASAADQAAELVEHLTVNAAAAGERAEQAAAALLAEYPEADRISAYLGLSEELTRVALRHWQADGA